MAKYLSATNPMGQLFPESTSYVPMPATYHLTRTDNGVQVYAAKYLGERIGLAVLVEDADRLTGDDVRRLLQVP